jgi:hypothetical protein
MSKAVQTNSTTARPPASNPALSVSSFPLHPAACKKAPEESPKVPPTAKKMKFLRYRKPNERKVEIVQRLQKHTKENLETRNSNNSSKQGILDSQICYLECSNRNLTLEIELDLTETDKINASYVKLAEENEKMMALKRKHNLTTKLQSLEKKLKLIQSIKAKNALVSSLTSEEKTLGRKLAQKIKKVDELEKVKKNLTAEANCLYYKTVEGKPTDVLVNADLYEKKIAEIDEEIEGIALDTVFVIEQVNERISKLK